jgi:glyoxylase-like metal-dependent hydrolase (beta-lactamase superfamily II)
MRAMRRASARWPPEVADRVFQLGTRWVNFHLVLEGRAATLVDAGYPRYAGQLDAAASALGLRISDVAAVIVTHHHVDHVGTAAYAGSRGAAVYVMQDDAATVRGARPSHPPQGFYREAWRPSMLRYLVHTIRVGGAKYAPCPKARALATGEVLDLPGRPRVLPTPGHTRGHCSVVLDDRGVVLAGDAMVNFDYASGAQGLALHRFNEDRDMARRSLSRFDDVRADTVLFGHGDPWLHGLSGALAAIRG